MRHPRDASSAANTGWEARLKAGLSEKEVWRKTGVAPRTLRDLEAGRHAPRTETLTALASLLEVSVDWLLGLPATRNGAT